MRHPQLLTLHQLCKRSKYSSLFDFAGHKAATRKRLLNLFSNPQFFQCTDYLCNKLQYGHG